MKSKHIAKLTIHGLPDMMKRKRNELVFWLRRIANEIDTEDPKIFSGLFRATLYKPEPIFRKK